VSGLVWLWQEQISAVTDSVPEQWQPDRTITSHDDSNIHIIMSISINIIITVHNTKPK